MFVFILMQKGNRSASGHCQDGEASKYFILKNPEKTNFPIYKCLKTRFVRAAKYVIVLLTVFTVTWLPYFAVILRDIVQHYRDGGEANNNFGSFLRHFELRTNTQLASGLKSNKSFDPHSIHTHY